MSGLVPAHQPGFVAVLDFPAESAAWIPLEEGLAVVETGLALSVDETGAAMTEVAIGDGNLCAVRIDTVRAEVCALPAETLVSRGLLSEAAPRMVTEFAGHPARTEVRLPQIAWGALRVRNPVCTVLDAGPGRIGLGLLEHARLHISFELGRVRVEPAPGKTLFVDAPVSGYGLSVAERAAEGWVVGVVRDGPAWLAGVRPGDVLLAVDNRSIPGTAVEAAALLQAAPDTPATMVFEREGARSPFLIRAATLL